MRRQYNKEYDDRESYTPWQTYSDLYCGLLLVFVLLFFFAIYQYIDARERNNADTAALQETMKEEQASVLALYKADLEDQQAAYEEKNNELEGQRTALAIMQSDLEERTELLYDQEELIEGQEQKLVAQEERLEIQEQKLKDQKNRLMMQQNQLEEQKNQLKEQQVKLEAQQELLDSQSDQIEQIVGVRGKLIDELNRELTANRIQIQADRTTGAIAVESTVLFATDSDELSEEGKDFFRRFMPVYMNVLLQPGFRDYIAEVIIEGHTDHTGAYLHNLELSQKRAGSVAEYFLNEECDFLAPDTVGILKSMITVNGCADKDPVYAEDGTIDEDSSRRVEIKFRLMDQEMIQEMDEILNNQRTEGLGK